MRNNDQESISEEINAIFHLSSLRCFLMREFQLEWMFLHSAVVKVSERKPWGFGCSAGVPVVLVLWRWCWWGSTVPLRGLMTFTSRVNWSPQVMTTPSCSPATQLLLLLNVHAYTHTYMECFTKWIVSQVHISLMNYMIKCDRIWDIMSLIWSYYKQKQGRTNK